MDWKPIETAPKDGTHIYCVRYNPLWPASLHFVSTVYWLQFDERMGEGVGIWMTEDRNEVDEPTHWAVIIPPKA